MKVTILGVLIASLYMGNAFAWRSIITFKGFEELCVRGHSDYDYWAKKLVEAESFVPDSILKNGEERVDLMICSAKKYGLNGFTEVYVVIFGKGQQCNEKESDGLFQVAAYNTNNLMVKVARYFFASSHFHGNPRQNIHAEIPFFQLIDDSGKYVLEAKFHSYDSAAPSADFRWEGKVYNSREYDRRKKIGKTFSMRVFGETQIADFNSDLDELNFNLDSKLGLSLATSNFIPTTWLLRDSGTHQQSWARRRSSCGSKI